MTNTFLFADMATTNLASALTQTATTIAVTTGTGQLFPQPGANQQFALILNSASGGSAFEIVYVTSVTGDTFTVVRGQEGTAGQPWNVGDIAYNGITSGQMAAMQQSNTAVTLAQVQAQSGNWATDGGTANALAVTLSPAPASLAAIEGAPIRVLKGAAANTGAVTLNVNGLGAAPVQLPGGTALTAGQLKANAFLELTWNAETNIFELLSPPANGFTMNAVEFTSPGSFTFNVPASALPVGFGIVTGAGGGAGFCGTHGGGGGGAGGTALGPISLTPGGTITGTVGTGGPGGNSGNGDGTTGGNTTLGSLVGVGGFGGQFNATVAGGQGGGASGGAINVQGGYGVDGSTTTNQAPWACGGGSYWGGGARAGASSGTNGVTPGTGGGAAYGTSGVVGGNGASGIAVLYYWTV